MASLAILLVLRLPEVTAASPLGGAVATEARVPTQEALKQLRAGGNAIDAAVTAALVSGVVHPTSSGIGGGGFAVVWLESERAARAFDFREIAPQGIDVAAFEQRPFAQEQRGKWVGVPGEVAGLFELHRRFGKRTWQQVVEPAVRVAKTGFAITPHMARVLKFFSTKLQADAGLKQLFFVAQAPNARGRFIKNPELGATLGRIAQGGAAAFYSGELAQGMVAATRAAGGALSMADLESYRVKERAPLKVSFDGHDVYTMPPPSAGGLMLAQALKVFSKAELAAHDLDSGAYQHLVAESLRASVADRMRHVGDPDFEAVPLAKLLSDARLKLRRSRIAPGRTHAIARFGLEEHGTHHLMTADGDGNLVSLTTTVNRAFGAKLSTVHGIVLNDELDDFTAQAHVAPFGMTRSPNRPRAGARPVSSMTPTLVVKDGQAVFGLGGSGGMMIATNVTQLVLAHLVFGTDAASLVKRPRFSIPVMGGSIELPKDASTQLVADLQRRGEIVQRARFDTSGVQLIERTPRGWVPASDPRKFGYAARQ